MSKETLPKLAFQRYVGYTEYNDPLRTDKLTDPRTLRAVAHPLRLALIGLLRREGPLTATRAGELLGESDALCSFHLRQLAKYGMVEEAGGGRGRERPWRATAQFTQFSSTSPEMAAATELFETVISERYFEHAMKWIQVRADAPIDWQEAAGFSDLVFHLTAAELSELDARIAELVEPYLQRNLDPSLRPGGARLIMFIRMAFPFQGPGSHREAPT